MSELQPELGRRKSGKLFYETGFFFVMQQTGGDHMQVVVVRVQMDINAAFQYLENLQER